MYENVGVVEKVFKDLQANPSSGMLFKRQRQRQKRILSTTSSNSSDASSDATSADKVRSQLLSLSPFPAR